MDVPEFGHIVWTFQLRRLAVLIGKALQFKEPILLVGETGCGKTTMVQLLSQLRNQKLFSVSCNMNSEGSDFIGGLRPVRQHLENVKLTKVVRVGLDGFNFCFSTFRMTVFLSGWMDH